MNFDVFNRVNVKESSVGMYAEWTSLSNQVVNKSVGGQQSVLNTLPKQAGKDVVAAVVRQLATNLGISQAPEPSPLITDRQVQWNMEVICFGLSLPLTEHEIVRDCVSIYCDWLTAFHSSAKISVPQPVVNDPNLYGRKIISHLLNLFVPRNGEGLDTINRQAVLCHRVLRTLQQVAQVSSSMTRETWEALLIFLITINDTLLAPPIVKDDVGDQLCERVLSVLLEVWLLACVRCFPSPPLWKTLREMCMNWRHRIALVEQWNRVHLALTAKLIDFTYGPKYPQLKINEEDGHIIPEGMDHDCVVQCWYRFLHCLGNPVHLCRPEIISQTPKFLQFAISSENVVDPCQHPCLIGLPTIFLKAMRGIAGQVDAFLGIATRNLYEEVCGDIKGKSGGVVGGGIVGGEKGGPSSSSSSTTQPTPPTQRRLAKSFSVAPAAAAVSKGLQKTSLIGLTSSRVVQPPSVPNSGPPSTSSLNSVTSTTGLRNPLAPNRPKCNSMLHLFGSWLFEAANIGHAATNRAFSAFHRKSTIVTNSQPSSLNEELDVPVSITLDKYSAGRAEALGALCRIFSAKKNGEEILPVYLARFYISLQQGLMIPETREITDVMANILLNSSDLLRVDLDGILMLLPAFVDALELVFSADKESSKSKFGAISRTELRQSCIQLLLSILVLPLHFQNLPIRELHPAGNRNIITVGQLKPRIMNILVDALQVESDPANTQMLLGGLLLAVVDAAVAEEAEIITQPDSSSNLFSYASDTGSARSTTSSDRRSLSGDSTHLPCEDNAHALFVRTTCLVCHRLISSWKGDLTVSLAALELLSALARVQIRESDTLEYKRAVRWLCEYIVCQCKKPPQAHSKDLHSSIVAAFHCCSVWLVQHPDLLDDKDFLVTILQVVELGISGSISQGKPGEPVKLKEEKESKPLSMRVRDAAESLLNILLEQVGHFPSPCGAETLSSLLDEISLLKHCNSWPGGDIDRVTACQRFKYFVVDNSILLALLEEPLGNDQDPQPTVTVIVRGPFGRHVWTMQLRHLPRHKSGRKHQHSINPGRPLPLTDVGTKLELRRQHFPESVDLIPLCKADRSIPSMESLSISGSGDDEKMASLMERQTELEEAISRVAASREISLPFPNPDRECQPPQPCHEFQTARLFLSHFGLLSLDSSKDYMKSPLTVIDTTQSGFCTELEILDMISPRTSDTVHMFYMRTGQTTAEEILHNALSESIQESNFIEIIHSLGWVVNVWQHPGWTGHVSTSWKVLPCPEYLTDNETQSNLSNFNGENYVIYWADVSSEIAFVLPTPRSCTARQSELSISDIASNQTWYERSVSVGQSNLRNDGNLKTRTMSLDLAEKSSEPVRPGRRAGSSKNLPLADPPTKIMLVWLESFEDAVTFPVADLLIHCNTGHQVPLQQDRSFADDVYVIYMQELQSGVVKVKLQAPTSHSYGRGVFPIPLVDGMVLPRRALAHFIRHTAINIARRRRLDSDSYQPPHVRRRLRVQELASKYQKHITQPQLLSYLFS